MRIMKMMPVVFLFMVPLGCAEDAPPLRFSIAGDAGISVPFGYIAEKHGLGGNAGLEIDYRFHKNIGFFAMFHHTYYGWTPEDPEGEIVSFMGGEYECIGFFGGVKGFFPVGKRLTLFGLLGAGSCEQESGDFVVKTRTPGPAGGYVEVDTATFNALQEGYFFGLIGGLGLEYELSRRFSVYAQIRVVKVFNTERTPPPQWAFLAPEIYQNPPDAEFMPLLVGICFKIF